MGEKQKKRQKSTSHAQATTAGAMSGKTQEPGALARSPCRHLSVLEPSPAASKSISRDQDRGGIAGM